MASFPGAKVHRVARRKLGRGQSIPAPTSTVAATAATVTVTLTFSAPVVASGTIGLGLTGVTLVSQTQTSATVVTQVYSATVVGKTWTFNGGLEPVRNFQGGLVAAATGTF